MKRILFLLSLLFSFVGFGQTSSSTKALIDANLPSNGVKAINATSLRNTLKAIVDFGDTKASSTELANSLSYKLQTVTSIGALQSYTTANFAHFDGSTWEKKTGNVTSNGGSFAGTLIRINSTTYWQRKTDFVTPQMFGAVGDGNNDDITAINLCLSSGIKKKIFPQGTYKITSPIVCNDVTLSSEKYDVVIKAYGCDAFIFTANTSNYLKGFYVIEYNTGGSINSKQFAGVKCNGTSLSNASFGNTITDVFFQGFKYGIYGKYVRENVFNNVRTSFCENGIILFGQSVNNSISNCNLNADISSVETIKDGSTQGEGLMISNTVMALGNYGVKSDGFLLLQVSNSIIDLVTTNAINVTNCLSLKVNNSWLYSTQEAILFNNLGAVQSQNANISNNTIESTANIGIFIGGNNTDIDVSHNISIKSGNTYICKTETSTDRVIFSYNNCKSTYAGFNIFVGGGNHTIVGNKGNCSVQYFDLSKRNIVFNNELDGIHTRMSSAPTTGTWKLSDIVWNNSPTSSSFLGWVCISAGTPGTWLGFGDTNNKATKDSPSFTNGVTIANNGFTSATFTINDTNTGGNTWLSGVGVGTGSSTGFSLLYNSTTSKNIIYGLNSGSVGIGTTTPTSRLQVKDGDFEAETIGTGFILKSSNGTRFRITVSNAGALSATSL